MPKPSDPIRAQLLAKAEAALNQMLDAGARIKAAEAETALAKELRESAMATYAKVKEAAQVFDYDLDKIVLEHFSQKGEPASDGNSPPSMVAITADTRPIREFVLAMAEAAYPRPVFASEMRLQLEKQRGAPLHQKTIGMTLYRLSKDGLIRREGQ